MDTADIGVVVVGGARSHQENYSAAFAAAGCTLLAVGLPPDLGEAERARYAELAQALELPLLPLAEAVRLPGARVASIAVPMVDRARVATLCADAGLHLYLDKPLAGSEEDARTIANAVCRNGVHAQVFSHATSPWARRARRAVTEGRSGPLLAVHAEMLMAKGVPSPLPSVRRREVAHPTNFPEDIAKRELTDMGVYPVSLVSWLVGRPALTVHAVTANHFFAEHVTRDVEDFGALLVEYEGGITASITCGRTGWASWRRVFRSRVLLVGETDTLVIDSEPAELIVTSGRGITPPAPNPVDPMDMWMSTARKVPSRPAQSAVLVEGNMPEETAAFLAMLSDGVQRGIGVDDAVQHSAIIAAAYRSAASGEPASVSR